VNRREFIRAVAAGGAAAVAGVPGVLTSGRRAPSVTDEISPPAEGQVLAGRGVTLQFGDNEPVPVLEPVACSWTSADGREFMTVLGLVTMHLPAVRYTGGAPRRVIRRRCYGLPAERNG